MGTVASRNDDHCREVFAAADHDGDGRLTGLQLHQFFAACDDLLSPRGGGAPAPTDVKGLLCRVAAARAAAADDGTLGWDELEAMRNAAAERAGSWPAGPRSGASKPASLASCRDPADAALLCDVICAAWDPHGSGQLAAAELDGLINAAAAELAHIQGPGAEWPPRLSPAAVSAFHGSCAEGGTVPICELREGLLLPAAEEAVAAAASATLTTRLAAFAAVVPGAAELCAARSERLIALVAEGLGVDDALRELVAEHNIRLWGSRPMLCEGTTPGGLLSGGVLTHLDSADGRPSVAAEPQDWVGASPAGPARYLFTAFYDFYDPDSLHKVDGLVELVRQGAGDALRDLLGRMCEKHAASGASLHDWLGPHPAALRFPENCVAPHAPPERDLALCDGLPGDVGLELLGAMRGAEAEARELRAVLASFHELGGELAEREAAAVRQLRALGGDGGTMPQGPARLPSVASPQLLWRSVSSAAPLCESVLDATARTDST
eukprot:TRINITY_DN31376_c0_g1_i1.p1 TRINITY_DN31376_c0_g1~~TRINITY_DN31376_c0_g1_i1.p1  ORF type:complete len:495 (+),score=103.46 TRINITY_DN31376_c0_g1_i1:90-1574(+)